MNTGTVAHDIGLLIPIFQVFGNNSTPGLTWDQSQDGWAGTVNGNSLLVTVTSPLGRLPESEVADLTGLTQETLSMFGQTTNPADAYPFMDFGILQPNQSAFTIFDFHFDWGGSGSGVPPPFVTPGNCGSQSSCTTAFIESVSRVPEPSSLLPLGTGLIGLIRLRRKRFA